MRGRQEVDDRMKEFFKRVNNNDPREVRGVSHDSSLHLPPVLASIACTRVLSFSQSLVDVRHVVGGRDGAQHQGTRRTKNRNVAQLLKVLLLCLYFYDK